ncbi:ribonuclease H-like domain-containing protein [Tanacetum coccineum]
MDINTLMKFSELTLQGVKVGNKANGLGTNGSVSGSNNPMKGKSRSFHRNYKFSQIVIMVLRTSVETKKKLGPEGSPLCLYMHDPREPHLNAMKRVLCYLRGNTDLGLQLFWSTTSQLIAYYNADWAGCLATRRSTSGYSVFLGDNLLTWSSKCQDTLSHSSAEAEYHGVANDVAETSWISNLLHELHTPLFTATLVYCDNVSAVYMSANPVQHQHTKHIEIGINLFVTK